MIVSILLLVSWCAGFMQAGIGSRGATGVASVRSSWKLPPAEAISDGSEDGHAAGQGWAN